MTADPLTILLRHNHWANGVILDRCATLSEDQLHEKFDIGFGSLHDTLDHIFGCMEHWAAQVRGETYKDWYAKQSIDQLRVRHVHATETVAELISQTQATGLLDRLIIKNFQALTGGTVSVRFTAAVAIIHCLVHGTHHRAQALNMLRRLNLGLPLPDLDVTDWQYETEHLKG